MGLGLFFIVGVASGVVATVVKLFCPPGDSGEVFDDRLVRFVFPFRFVFGWELFFRVVFFIGVDGGLGNRQTFFIEGGAGFLYPLSSLDRQRRRSFSVRNTPSRESTVFGPAAISMLWSCGLDVTCGSWSGSAVSHLVVFSGLRDVWRRLCVVCFVF